MSKRKPTGIVCQEDFTTRVRVALVLSGKNIAQIARKHHLSRNGVSRVVNGHANFPAVLKALSEELGL